MGRTIREIRRMKEISQQDMADACGIHINTYVNWEEHPERIKVGKFLLLLKVLGVGFDDVDIFSSESTKNIN